MDNQTKETKLCKHCQTEIPKKAKVCPNCRKKQGGILKWVIIVLVILVIIGSAGGAEEDKNNENAVVESTENKEHEVSVKETEQEITEENLEETEEVLTEENFVEPEETEEEYKASCEEYKYKDVLRNPEDYIGKRIKVTVKISTVHEASWLNDTKYYFAYTKNDYGWYGDCYGVFDERTEQNPKLLADDVITVYGEISDPEYTTSLIVSGSELFCIDMKYIDFISE